MESSICKSYYTAIYKNFQYFWPAVPKLNDVASVLLLLLEKYIRWFECNFKGRLINLKSSPAYLKNIGIQKRANILKKIQHLKINLTKTPTH